MVRPFDTTMEAITLLLQENAAQRALRRVRRSGWPISSSLTKTKARPPPETGAGFGTAGCGFILQAPTTERPVALPPVLAPRSACPMGQSPHPVGDIATNNSIPTSLLSALSGEAARLIGSDLR